MVYNTLIITKVKLKEEIRKKLAYKNVLPNY